MGLKHYTYLSFEFNLLEYLTREPDTYFLLVRGGKGVNSFYEILLIKDKQKYKRTHYFLDNKHSPNVAMLIGIQTILAKLINNTKVYVIVSTQLGFESAKIDKGINFDYVYHIMNTADKKNLDCKIFSILNYGEKMKEHFRNDKKLEDYKAY